MSCELLTTNPSKNLLIHQMPKRVEARSIEQFKDGSYLKSILFNMEYIKLIQRFILWSFASIFVYLLWIFDISVAPAFLLLLIIALHHEKEKLKSMQGVPNQSIMDEKKMIESYFKADNVPSWILFPDKERTEWINTIIDQIWPNIGAFIRDVMFGLIEPEVKTSFENYGITGFCFKTIALGNIPPRVTGIKVYDKKVARNQIIIDTDLLFTSDCDITISLKGMNIGVRDLKFKGALRLELKPLITEFPLFKTAEVYFLRTPEIDYNLSGIANILDLTGIVSILQEAIIEITKELIVFPNKIRLFERS